jgi:flagellar assembly protein FliH
MSSRARRLTVATATSVTPWIEAITDGSVPASGRRPASIVSGGAAPAVAALAAAPTQAPGPRPGQAAPAASAAQEREIFAKGFAEGERAGAAAAQAQSAALAKQLTGSLEDLTRVRAEMIRHTEKQMVQLAVAVARRVVHREVSLDPNLLLAMMRVALDRLSEAVRVTVRLHPADHRSAVAALAGQESQEHVTLVADPRLPRGGCRVESDYGDIEAGVDGQIQEVARALLGDDRDMAP